MFLNRQYETGMDRQLVAQVGVLIVIGYPFRHIGLVAGLEFEMVQPEPVWRANLIEVVQVHGLEADLAAKLPHLGRFIEPQCPKEMENRPSLDFGCSLEDPVERILHLS